LQIERAAGRTLRLLPKSDGLPAPHRRQRATAEL